MTKFNKNETFNLLNLSITSFLTGIFFIITIFQIEMNGIDIGMTKILVFIIILLLAIIGFTTPIAIFPVNDNYKTKVKEWAPTLFIWIFTLSIAQIAVNIAVLYSSYKEIHPMLVPFIVIVSIAYLLFIIGLEIYINKKIKVFENIGKLLIAILMFFGVTLTLILQEEKIEVILPYSIFTGLLIIWTIYIYSRKYGRKKKKKGQV
jgi:hypothetical protein